MVFFLLIVRGSKTKYVIYLFLMFNSEELYWHKKVYILWWKLSQTRTKKKPTVINIEKARTGCSQSVSYFMFYRNKLKYDNKLCIQSQMLYVHKKQMFKLCIHKYIQRTDQQVLYVNRYGCASIDTCCVPADTTCIKHVWLETGLRIWLQKLYSAILKKHYEWESDIQNCSFLSTWRSKYFRDRQKFSSDSERRKNWLSHIVVKSNVAVSFGSGDTCCISTNTAV